MGNQNGRLLQKKIIAKLGLYARNQIGDAEASANSCYPLSTCSVRSGHKWANRPKVGKLVQCKAENRAGRVHSRADHACVRIPLGKPLFRYPCILSVLLPSFTLPFHFLSTSLYRYYFPVLATVSPCLYHPLRLNPIHLPSPPILGYSISTPPIFLLSPSSSHLAQFSSRSTVMTWLFSLLERFIVRAWRLLFPRSSKEVCKHSTSIRPDIPIRKSNPCPPISLLSLPDDILFEIVRTLTHSPHPTRTTSMNLVEQHTYKNGLPLASTSKKLAKVFYNSLDNVCLSSTKVDDAAVQALSTNASHALRRLVLRACHVSNVSLQSLKNVPNLRSIDLSFVNTIDYTGIIAFCSATAPRLTTLLLRRCPGVSDAAMSAIAKCHQLHTLDLSYCKKLTDTGIVRVTSGCSSSLRLLAIAHIPSLTDQSFAAVGSFCTNLTQFCARGLSYVTDIGFAALCLGIGNTAEGIDITSCNGLTRDATLRSLRLHCPRIYSHIMPAFAARSLRQIIISTLRQNIFIVHGSDPHSGKETVHTVLIDNGDIVSASLLSSGTIDLSMLGVVLCKSYGSGLTDDTKKMLETDYGIPTTSLTD